MRFVGLALWGLSAAGLMVACGDEFEADDEGSGGAAACNVDPWSCPAAQTCWLDRDRAWRCLNQGDGRLGEACNLYLDSPTCAAGHFCVPPRAGEATVCMPYCDNTDPNRACPAGYLCAIFEDDMIAGSVNVCVPET